ncbi:hypothetical protein L208DRAFT_417907 [Tricholoma matsutake]|nr:hypothetical protein L208DRAFT_417907 [Tricholoma matsutake 945]
MRNGTIILPLCFLIFLPSILSLPQYYPAIKVGRPDNTQVVGWKAVQEANGGTSDNNCAGTKWKTSVIGPICQLHKGHGFKPGVFGLQHFSKCLDSDHMEFDKRLGTCYV